MSFIPNSFQLPNAYVDWYWHLLTSEEKDVLIYIARRIYGFHGKTCDGISLSQFERGIVTKEGKRLDHGTGLGRTAILAALDELLRFRLVLLVRAAVKCPPKARRPAVYALQLDCSQVDSEAMEVRAQIAKDKGRTRIQAANIAKEVRRLDAENDGHALLCGSSTEPHGEVSSHDTNNYQGKASNRREVSSRGVREASSRSEVREPTPTSLFPDAFSADDDWPNWEQLNDN